MAYIDCRSVGLCSILVLFGIFLKTTTAGGVPEQVHVSLGGSENEYVVTWNINDSLMECYGSSEVLYGLEKGFPTWSVAGDCTMFECRQFFNRTFYIHRATLTGLSPFTRYCMEGTNHFDHVKCLKTISFPDYQCITNGNASDILYFTTTGSGTNWSPRLLIYGDLGLGGESIRLIQEEVDSGTVDGILHIGDIAYDLESNFCRDGDAFMNEMQPIASKVVYQTCAGNHEQDSNSGNKDYANYDNRFSMYDMSSKKKNNHFYSFHLGPALFVMFNSDFYYYYERVNDPRIVEQYNWLNQTLTKANLPENRSRFPWLITLSHRPMYCSNNDSDECTHKMNVLRNGKYGLEDMFYQNGVDIAFWGHEHSYERSWPVYDYDVYYTPNQDYVNPAAPIHIVTGSAGCPEELDGFNEFVREWSALRLSEYGVSRMTILNGSHIQLDYLSEAKKGKVVDSITLVQENHGPRFKLGRCTTTEPTNQPGGQSPEQCRI